ncbi:MAG TPA: hypothetical protein VGN07_10600 [Steroidobacteraceae bacterium]|jgi:hypothetical protein
MLKWVGAITAVLSLIFAIQQLIQGISEVRGRERQVTELSETGTMQQQAGDYAAAWTSFDTALQAAQSGGMLMKLFGRLDTQTLHLRLAREDLAMLWLENIRTSGGQTFSDIVEKLLPALDQGVRNAQPVRKADLLSHIGWAYFLRYRDGHRELDPEPQYRQALVADAANPYAHAYLGHWLLWTKRDLNAAREQFAAGVASGRKTTYVRNLQLSAIRNLGSDGDAEYVAVVSDMYGRQEPLSGDVQREVLSDVLTACRLASDGQALRQSLSATPADRLLDIYRLLGTSEETRARLAGREAEQASCNALILEAADRREEALTTWKSVRSRGKQDAAAYAKATAGIARLATARKT